MILLLAFAKGLATALIFVLTGIAFIPTEAANWLTSLQKFLAKEIQRRRP